MNLQQKYKKLQSENKILIECNKKALQIDENLNVLVTYTCGKIEKIPFMNLLKPKDYHALLFGDVIYQTKVVCKKHCKRKMHYLKLKPLKSDKDLKKLWNLEHGKIGYANLTIRLTTESISDEASISTAIS